jgi:hypothetical protein
VLLGPSNLGQEAGTFRNLGTIETDPFMQEICRTLSKNESLAALFYFQEKLMSAVQKMKWLPHLDITYEQFFLSVFVRDFLEKFMAY